MRGTPYNKIVNRYWRMIMWNKTDRVEYYMATTVTIRRNKKKEVKYRYFTDIGGITYWIEES